LKRRLISNVDDRHSNSPYDEESLTKSLIGKSKAQFGKAKEQISRELAGMDKMTISPSPGSRSG
jgi:hypothetical protein